MAGKKLFGRSTVGLKNVCYAMLTETENGHEYGEVVQAAGAIDVTIAPSSENTSQYADDGTYESFTSLGDIEISMEMAGLAEQAQIDWSGHRLDANGVLVKNKDDQGHYFALGFEAKETTGKRRRMWVYKCKAALPEDAAHTTEGTSATFGTAKLKITAMALPDTGDWQTIVREDSVGVEKEIFDAFLDSVYEPED